MRGLAFISATLLAVLAAVLYGPVTRSLTILGVFRNSSPAPVASDKRLFRKIDDTVQCEDVHYYRPADKLFAACEDVARPRYEWWPPMTTFRKPSEARGSIHVVDPRTMKSTRLSFENFEGPFVTHGIEVIEDPVAEDAGSGAVYIFAVNHRPNPEYYPSYNQEQKETPPDAAGVPKCQSQIELFHHSIGSTSVKHVRTIRHPLITTPNDIYAESPSSFYVTNDHFYREGILRTVEDMIPAAKWSNIIHVQIEDPLLSSSPSSSSSSSKEDPESNLQVSVALEGLHNPNGLGHGKSGEMLIVSAMGGVMHRARVDETNHTISIVETIPFDSQLDNPTYFSDPYRTDSDDASGYLVPGLTRPIDTLKTQVDPFAKDGSLVWYLRPNRDTTSNTNTTTAATSDSTGANKGENRWERHLLFEDDGTNLRSASTAVLIPIDPQLEHGKKRGWLFTTGFFGEAMVAVKVDL